MLLKAGGRRMKGKEGEKKRAGAMRFLLVPLWWPHPLFFFPLHVRLSSRGWPTKTPVTCTGLHAGQLQVCITQPNPTPTPTRPASAPQSLLDPGTQKLIPGQHTAHRKKQEQHISTRPMSSSHNASGPTSFGQGYSLSSSSSSPSATAPVPPPASRHHPRKEILNYSAPWPVYGLDWSNQPTEREALRLAVGSFIEDGSNKVRRTLFARPLVFFCLFARHIDNHGDFMYFLEKYCIAKQKKRSLTKKKTKTHSGLEKQM